MGSAHSSSSAVCEDASHVKRCKQDLKLLRSVSPEVERPINWEEEKSVESHVCVNTMENLVLAHTLKRSKSWPQNMKLTAIRNLLPVAKKKKKLRRSVSFSTPMFDLVNNIFDRHADEAEPEGCEVIEPAEHEQSSAPVSRADAEIVPTSNPFISRALERGKVLGMHTGADINALDGLARAPRRSCSPQLLEASAKRSHDSVDDS